MPRSKDEVSKDTVWVEYRMTVPSDITKDTKIANAVSEIGGTVRETSTMCYVQIAVEVETDKRKQLKERLRQIEGVTTP